MNSSVYHLHHIAPYRVVMRGTWARVHRGTRCVLEGAVSLAPAVKDTLKDDARGRSAAMAQCAARSAQEQGL